MKKTMKSIISTMLGVMLIVSMMPVMAFADAAPDKYASLKKGCGYVAIGDSFTRGYGADLYQDQDGNWKSAIYDNETDTVDSQVLRSQNCRNVKNSFPNYIAEKMDFCAPTDITDNTAKYWPIAHDAVSVAYILNLLGIDDAYSTGNWGCRNDDMQRRYAADLLMYGDNNCYQYNGGKHEPSNWSNQYHVMNLTDMIENGDLFTVQVGEGDVQFMAFCELGSLDFNNTEKLPAEISEFVKRLYKRFEYFKANFPKIIEYIKEKNSDAKIVIVGTMNPMENVMFSDDVLLPIGSAFNVITDLMNKFYKECAKKYNCMYVDINDVETPSTEKHISLNTLMNEFFGETEYVQETYYLQGHPSATGYQQIGRAIVAAIDKELEENPYIPAVPDTKVKIDLGSRSGKLNYVTVDGKKVNAKYDENKSLLTVDCKTKDAKTMNVALLTTNTIEEGKTETKIVVMTYTLKYNKTTGYSARRVYVTNDVVHTATTTIKTVNKVINSGLKAVKTGIKNIADAVKGWFSSIKLPSFNY